MKILSGLLLMVALFVAGCADKPGPEPAKPAENEPARPAAQQPQERPAAAHGESTPELRVRNTVVLYIGYLIEGYKSLNMTPLQMVASKERAESAYFHMAALGEGKVRMVSELKKIDFKDISFPEPDRMATVKTEEVWDFAYVNRETGEKTGEVKNFLYRMTYTLENREGRWLVTGAETEGGEPPAAGAPKVKQGR